MTDYPDSREIGLTVKGFLADPQPGEELQRDEIVLRLFRRKEQHVHQRQ